MGFLLIFQRPVVLYDTNLVTSALKWDLDYLEKYIGDGDFTVFCSKNHIFKYYDESKCRERSLGFIPPTTKAEMKFPQFADKLRHWKPGEDR